MMTIRLMQPDDLPLLSEYWYDQMALLQQTHPHIRLQGDARIQWEIAARGWLAMDTTHCLSATVDSDIVGGMVGAIVANQPGLLPVRIGRVQAMVIDLHTPHKQQGTGRHLLRTLNTWFRQQGIEQVQASAPLNYAVVQAFWRGVGANRTDTIFWMTL